MKILGLNYAFHDPSACIYDDGQILFAVEEERLSRKKHGQEFPFRSAALALKNTDTKHSDLRHIAVSTNPRRDRWRKIGRLAGCGQHFPAMLDYEFVRSIRRNRDFETWRSASWPGSPPSVHWVDHHLSHGVGSFLVSPFDSAAILSIDGWGEWATTWLGRADASRYARLNQSFYPNSLGCFYSAATAFCGFKTNYDEGKTMGLAPYGDAKRFYNIVSSFIRINDDGGIVLDQGAFDFRSYRGRFFGPRFLKVFGAPRRPAAAIEQHHKDVAAAFQVVLEESVLKMASLLRRTTGESKLVLAGGVAMNSVANGRVARESGYQDVYIMPGAGDNGTCIGSAAFVSRFILNNKSRCVHNDPYTGTCYSDDEIKAVLDVCNIKYDVPDDICSAAAAHLNYGHFVGWFQGRMEFGARALGGRSILASPKGSATKDKINSSVKFREDFRPFAPSCPVERYQEYFEAVRPSPFMLEVSGVRKEHVSELAATTHVDGTARLQTVDAAINPRFHRLHIEFAKLSGLPILLNTSFNVMGEPIVESPQQALRCFFSNGLHVLAIGKYLVTK